MLKKERESSIELLKIFGMFLIVIFHVTQTLCTTNPNFEPSYVIEVNKATNNIQELILIWFHSFGNQGNIIFLVCSAWFLLKDNKINTKKIFHMAFDVWVISCIFLFCFIIGGWFNLSLFDVFISLFPNITCIYWYITCYILFYLTHCALNQIICSRNKKQLLIINVICLTIYSGLNYLHKGLLFSSNLIYFIVIYFAIAYVKNYMPNFCKNKKYNLITLFIGLLGPILLIIITNFLALYIPFIGKYVTLWVGLNSPFIILETISLFNLCNNIHFTNRKINKLSSLTLLIYIIHENYLLRTYIRPLFWIFIHDKIGYQNVILLDILLSFIIFVCAIFVSYIYQRFLQTHIYKIGDKLFDAFEKLFQKSIEKLCNYN